MTILPWQGRQLNFGTFNDIMQSNFDTISMLSEASMKEAQEKVDDAGFSDNTEALLAENLRRRSSSVISNIFSGQDDALMDSESKNDEKVKDTMFSLVKMKLFNFTFIAISRTS